MAVYVSEHSGYVASERQAVSAPLASYSLSSGSTPPILNARTAFVRVSADAASLFAFTTSTSSTGGLVLTSTNALRVPANAVPERFQIPLSLSGSTAGPFRVAASST